jgi:hypothetical protein
MFQDPCSPLAIVALLANLPNDLPTRSAIRRSWTRDGADNLRSRVYGHFGLQVPPLQLLRMQKKLRDAQVLTFVDDSSRVALIDGC